MEEKADAAAAGDERPRLMSDDDDPLRRDAGDDRDSRRPSTGAATASSLSELDALSLATITTFRAR